MSLFEKSKSQRDAEKALAAARRDEINAALRGEMDGKKLPRMLHEALCINGDYKTANSLIERMKGVPGALPLAQTFSYARNTLGKDWIAKLTAVAIAAKPREDELRTRYLRRTERTASPA